MFAFDANSNKWRVNAGAVRAVIDNMLRPHRAQRTTLPVKLASSPGRAMLAIRRTRAGRVPP